jgi:hypothetical protein
MAADTPMKLRRRLPGMPASADTPRPRRQAGEAGTGESAAGGRAEASPSANGVAGRGASDGASRATAPERRAGAHSERRRQRPEQAGRGDVNPYAGAGTTSLNVRILVPLHNRYRKLVRELEDEGYKSSATELFHALLHFGPSDTAEARELLRSWRSVLDADPPR